jgi:ABC-type spermidine/putrescine transport system permease subunit II
LKLVLFTLREIWLNGGRQSVGSASIVVFFASLVIVPIAFAWKSTNLDAGFHGAVSVLLILSGVAMAIGLYMSSGDGDGLILTWHRRHHNESDDSSSEDV